MPMSSKGDFDAIPILDVSALRDGGAEGVKSVAGELRGYLENVGFLYIRGHDVPRSSIEAVRAESRRFHNLPLDEKMKLKMDRNFRGYIPINTSTIVTSSVAKVTKPNQSESLMLMHEVAADDPDAVAGKPLQGPNQWPAEDLLPGFRNVVEAYVSQMNALGRQMLIENPSSYIAFAGAMPEWEFLNELVARTGCGLLLDVNNIHVSAANHGFSAAHYLAAIRPGTVGQIHLAGHSQTSDLLVDTHDQLVPDMVWALYRAAVARFGAVPAMIERDDNIPELPELLAELDTARAICAMVPA